MARRIIRHEPTEAQWDVIDSLFDPYVKARGSENGEIIQVYEVIDDSDVNLYTIKPDGEYVIESLVALNHGWEILVPGEDDDY